MKLLYACDDFVRAWVKDKIPHMADGDFGPSTAIGVVMGDRLIAGAVYHNWHGGQAQNMRVISVG